MEGSSIHTLRAFHVVAAAAAVVAAFAPDTSMEAQRRSAASGVHTAQDPAHNTGPEPAEFLTKW
jgi:hypothetical protein